MLSWRTLISLSSINNDRCMPRFLSEYLRPSSFYLLKYKLNDRPDPLVLEGVCLSSGTRRDALSISKPSTCFDRHALSRPCRHRGWKAMFLVEIDEEYLTNALCRCVHTLCVLRSCGSRSTVETVRLRHIRPTRPTRPG